MTSVTIVDTKESGTSISRALEQLRVVESSHLPDVVIPMRELLWTNEGSIVIPEHSEARPTEWARLQVAQLLGVKFDRWFEAATPMQQSEEMNRRLARATGNVRLRLLQHDEGTVLRAVVSPGYSSIEDSTILEVLANSLKDSAAHVYRLDLTDRLTAITICVGEPQYVGGDVGKTWGTISLRNSGVGWSGLAVSQSILRLACSNGMRAPIHTTELLRLRHRHLDLSAIQNQLRDGMRSLPGRLTEASRVLGASTGWNVVNVPAEARALLRERGLIQRHLKGVLAAFRMEARESVFGISQAIGLYAQAVSPEDRLVLEDLAGSYVLRAAP